MTTGDRVLMYLALAIIGLALIFGIASIVVPGFRAEGTLMAGTILGALVSFGSVVVGVNAAKVFNRETPNQEDGEGER